LPGYFEEYACPHEADKVDELAAMRRFIHTHADSHRLQRDRDLTRQQRLDLHELEAQVCHRMSWELQVAESYRWHKLIAHRQKQTFEKHLQELKPNQILHWSDYKQNLTIPMAHTETGGFFFWNQQNGNDMLGVHHFQEAWRKPPHKACDCLVFYH